LWETSCSCRRLAYHAGAIFNTRLMGNPYCRPTMPLSTPTLRKTSSSFSGISTFQHPSYGKRVLCIPTGHSLSTPILRETCVFRCEVCYNVVSFTPPRETMHRHSYGIPLFQHPFHGKLQILLITLAAALNPFNTHFMGNDLRRWHGLNITS
jgi:hypothetical protein